MNRTLLALLLILLCCLGGAAQNAEDRDTTITTYRRSALTSILLTHSERPYGREIRKEFLNIPIPDKFDDHTIPLRTVEMRVPRRERKAKAALDKMITGREIPRAIVNKWYNRNPRSGLFDRSVFTERGYYDATYYDVNLAKQMKRGFARLADAGQQLVGNTFVLVNDITYFDKSVAAQIGGAFIMVAGAVGTIATGDTSFLGLGRNLGSLVSKIEGFKVTVTSHLYRLDWNDSIMNSFYDAYYIERENLLSGDIEMISAKKLAYETAPDPFSLSYVGTQKVKSGKTSMKGINRDTPEEMIRKVCARAIDKSIVKLQESHEEFRIKTPLFRTRIDSSPRFLPFLSRRRERVMAKVGMKEGVTTRSKFEVLEAKLDDGKISYKRMGIVKPVSGKIWDNRYMAMEEDARGARLNGTEFRVVRGSNLKPGMLIRECRNPVDYQANCFGVDVGFGVIPGLGVASDVSIRWLHNFTPHFGWDVIYLKGIYGSGIHGVQAMSGIRLQTSQLINPKKLPLLKHSTLFSKKMSLFYALRLGGNASGFCYDIEGGVNLTKKFFVGVASNHQSWDDYYISGYNSDGNHYYGTVSADVLYVALRTGFNF